TMFNGFFGPSGLSLIGYEDGIAFPGFALVGDPLRREAELSDGDVLVPNDPRQLPPTGMIEAWVRAGGGPGTVAARDDGTNGYTLGVSDGAMELRVHNAGEERVLRSAPVIEA